MRSGNGRHRRPRQAPALFVAAGVTGAGIAIPLLGATGAQAADAGTWDRVAQCESGGEWSANAANGRYGGLQLTLQLWEEHGGTKYAERPDLASRSQQIAVADEVLFEEGAQVFEDCAETAGLTDTQGQPPNVDPGDESGDGSRDEAGGGGYPAPSDPSEPSEPPSSGPSDPPSSSEPSDPPSSEPSAPPSAGPSDRPSEPSGKPSEQPSGKPSEKPSDPPSSELPTDPSDAPVDPAQPAQPGGDRGWGDGEEADSGNGKHRGDPGDREHPSRGGDRDHGGKHRVQAGDSLSQIADQEHVPGGWTALYERNRDVVGDDPDLILPGQNLRY
ncbi:transglycosylase family protein [Streptomyces iconiensis]|uniref:Transglycosylase family protein n=1 Tax=Streptomyces iconiensis TaxID=1384038 RepID=A0ABT7AAC9_9ACTN|nr:transglycosylase family protein [Streptomyces iconiensis]MDJ1138285.1 transglycosylase family protein [Streptomyces iconiensis]